MLILGFVVFVFISPLINAATYLYIHASRSYEEGRQLCSDFGLDLAKVSSEENIDDLHAIYSSISGSDVAWIGIRYVDPSFYWPDGTLASHTRWNNVSDDEPDRLDVSKCAAVKQSILLWHTRKCTDEYPVLCGPYPQSENTPEMKLTSFTKWRNGEEFTSPPTAVKQKTSSRACAKDCMILENCMFFSLGGDTCKMYSDITSMNTKNRNESLIWKKNTITIDW